MRRAGGLDWSLRFPSSPRTIQGMKSWPGERERDAASVWRLAGSLGLGLGGAKVMLNSREAVMRVGRMDLLRRESEGFLKKVSWW